MSAVAIITATAACDCCGIEIQAGTKALQVESCCGACVRLVCVACVKKAASEL